eukprot:jgi/Tetstr1/465879/TSEL_010496.t1
MHVDSSGYGWGAVLKETTEARGLWNDGDRELHITCKELKAVRYAVLTFLSELRSRQMLPHEDNMGVIHNLANLISRSPLLMTELRKLWFILDTNDISILRAISRPRRPSQLTAFVAARLTTTKTWCSTYATSTT